MSQSVKARILKGLGASSFGQVVNVFVQLVGLPAYLAALGAETYGDWLILGSWAQLLAMTDVGFSSAAGNEMAMHIGRGDRQSALAVFQSIWVTLLGLAMVSLAIAALVLGFAGIDHLPLSRIDPRTSMLVLMILAGTVVINLQLGLVHSAFRCDGNYALGELLSSGLRLCEFLCQVVVAFASHSLIWLAATSLIVRMVALAICLVILKRQSPWLTLGWNAAEFTTVRRLLVPAVSFLGVPLGHAIVIQGMLNVVALVCGAPAVVVFDSHRRLTNAGTQFIGLVNHSFWPELSRAQGAGDISLCRRLHRAACTIAFWLATCCAAALMAFGWLILPVWTGGAIHENVPLLAGLLAALILRSLWYTSAVILMSSNRHERMALVFSASGLASLAVAWWLLPSFQLPAAGFAAAFGELVMLHYVLRQALRITDDNVRDFSRAVVDPIAVVRASARNA